MQNAYALIDVNYENCENAKITNIKHKAKPCTMVHILMSKTTRTVQIHFSSLTLMEIHENSHGQNEKCI